MIEKEIDKMLSDWNILYALNNNDIPYAIAQIRGLIKEIEIKTKAKGYKNGYKKGVNDFMKEVLKEDGIYCNDLTEKCD